MTGVRALPVALPVCVVLAVWAPWVLTACQGSSSDPPLLLGDDHTWVDARSIRRVSVTDTLSDSVLFERCYAESNHVDDPGVFPRFRAAPGALVRETLTNSLITKESARKEFPEDSDEYWCGDFETSHVGYSETRWAKCDVVSGDDPPAEIVGITTVPEESDFGSTSYTLDLGILHPGVLLIESEPSCVEDHLIKDVFLTEPTPELEILE